MGAVAAAIISRREREIIDAFRRERALSPDTARSLGDVGVEETWVLDRLRDRAVIRPAGAGYYLDEPVWAAVHRMRRRLAWIVAAMAVLMAVVVWMATRALSPRI